MDDINTRIDQYAQQELKAIKDMRALEPDDQQPVAQPIDVYQNKRNNRYENSWKAESYGAPTTLNVVAQQMADNVEPIYNLATNQFNHLQEYGMQEDAQAMADDYMENDFIPMVMGFVDQYGADAILKNQRALEVLDSKALTGNGDGTGYTAAFIKAMAPEVQGTVASVTDASLEQDINRMKELANSSPKAAISLAKRLKDQIDNGMVAAGADDYRLIARVAFTK